MFSERDLLLPYQKEWLDEPAQVAVIEKGRRAGVSWAQAGSDASYAIGKAGGNVWYMGQDKDMSLAYITDVAWWASEVFGALNPQIKEDIWEDGKERVLAYSVKFASGFKCTALSSRPANLRSKGRPGDRFTFDEVAFHPDFEGLLKAAGALLMWGCRIRMISTHNGAGNPFNILIEDIRAGKRPGAVHRVTFDEAVAQGLHQRICQVSEQVWTPEKQSAWVAEIRAFYGDNAAEELDVIPSAGSGVFLTRAQIRSVMQPAPVLRIKQTEEFTYAPQEERRAWMDAWLEDYVKPVLTDLERRLSCFLGQDFALVSDLSSIVITQQQQNLDLLTVLVIEMSNVPYDQQKQVFHYLQRKSTIIASAIDATGNGAILAQEMAQAYGASQVAEIKISESWYLKSMPLLKTAILDKTLSIALDDDIMADLREIKMIDGVPKIPKTRQKSGDNQAKRHGDTAVAYALTVWAVDQLDAAPIEYEPLIGENGRDKGLDVYDVGCT